MGMTGITYRKDCARWGECMDDNPLQRMVGCGDEEDICDGYKVKSKVMVYSISFFKDASALIVSDMKTVLDNLHDLEVGDEITITVKEMEEHDYKNLPEWDGP